jgi:23S rRNA (cytosine1962-C5)-methyltransferase
MSQNFSAVHCPVSIPTIELTRDVTKHLKRGHRWIFSDCFQDNPKIKEGLNQLIFKKEIIALGIVQKETHLRFRVLFLTDESCYRKNNLNQSFIFWCERQWQKALAIRSLFPNAQTDCFRLINGEGDGFPGLVIDIYRDTAVIKLDHLVMEKVWNLGEITSRLREDFPFLKCIYHKRKNKEDNKGETLFGTLAAETIFQENNVLFTSNIRDAAKTGFFLDQRDNRHLVGHFSKNKKVLNLFSYTGGFSLFAAKGGASAITSVDISKEAIKNVQKNFELNDFKNTHHDIAVDAFKFIEEQKEKHDIVIADPPSFAPNQKAIETATEAYQKVFASSLKLVSHEGYFCASSCSSHITHEMFLSIIKESFSKAKKRGTIVKYGGQPFDHPYPIAMDELRYLKFILLRVD